LSEAQPLLLCDEPALRRRTGYSARVSRQAPAFPGRLALSEAQTLVLFVSKPSHAILHPK
ncbi:MAG: hypothetical protein ACLFT8_07070, partial [Desulfovermiculus sp.]